MNALCFAKRRMLFSDFAYSLYKHWWHNIKSALVQPITLSLSLLLPSPSFPLSTSPTDKQIYKQTRKTDDDRNGTVSGGVYIYTVSGGVRVILRSERDIFRGDIVALVLDHTSMVPRSRTVYSILKHAVTGVSSVNSGSIIIVL